MSVYPILLLIASLALLAVEVIVVSFGLIALMAIACGVGSVMLAFAESEVYGWTMIGLLLVGAPVVLRGAFIILPKIPFARGMFLRAPKLTEGERHAADQADRSLLGAIGVASSPLRPSGTAILNDVPCDVIAAGGTMIERGTRVRVTEISGNRLIVERAESDPVPESTD